MLSFKTNIVQALETRKIQEEISRAAVTILVGFPSGRQHVETLHKNDEGQYESYDHGDPRDDKAIETAELAKALSFGTGTIPARPFLEDGIKSKQKEIMQALKTEAEKAINGQTPNWNKVGTMAVGAIEELVRSDYYRTRVPNAKRTIEYKGSDTPLIDGADLLNSLVYTVEGSNQYGNLKESNINIDDYRGNK